MSQKRISRTSLFSERHHMTDIRISENVLSDPQRGFASFGEFANSVAGAAVFARRRTGTAMDSRLKLLAAAPGTFGGEGSGADGGLLVPPGFSDQLRTLQIAEETQLLDLTSRMEIDGNSMLIPKDETTPWGTNGMRAYWQSEGLAGTQTKPVIGAMDMRLKKLIGLVPITNELAADSNALGPYLQSKIAASISWKLNESILYGSGVGQPLGAISSGATVVVAKDTGQATLTLSALNLANMIAALLPNSFKRSVWLISPSALPALSTLTLGNYPMYLPTGGGESAIAKSPYDGMLLGRPVIFTWHASAFSAAGDVLLVDLSYYQSIAKAGGIDFAQSAHLYFDADAMAFRATYRIDGAPLLTKPVAAPRGGSTLAPVVMLGAR
jgi:HK97 family phage major capsid protein